MLAALIVVSAGIVALFLVLRGRLRRAIPPKTARRRPAILDAWAAAGARADFDDDDTGENREDPDDPDTGGDDDHPGDGPMPPVPETPSLSCKA